MFNEHTVHSFIAGDGREEGREVGSVMVTLEKNKNNEKWYTSRRIGERAVELNKGEEN